MREDKPNSGNDVVLRLSALVFAQFLFVNQTTHKKTFDEDHFGENKKTSVAATINTAISNCKSCGTI